MVAIFNVVTRSVFFYYLHEMAIFLIKKCQHFAKECVEPCLIATAEAGR